MITDATIASGHTFVPVPPSQGNLQAFLTAAEIVVGSDFVCNSEETIASYAQSCSATSRRSLAVIQPSCTEEVQQIVLLAGKYSIKLYPISRGCNWGLGDACPTTDNQVILDLRRMNRITTADAQLGAFTVEPGVTQQQMFEYLRDNQLPFWYDASGAGPNASLLGNLMERGYGHTPLGERFINTCNYHVVMADGSFIKTGFGEIENCKVKDLFKPGVGPSLDGLFTQSNFGIVTRATFWMMRIPEHFEAYVIQLDSDTQLYEAIDALQPLRASGIIASALHIGNDFRVLSARMQFPYDKLDGSTCIPTDMRRKLCQQYGAAAWNGLGAYYGTKRGAAAFRSDLRRALRGIAKPIFLTEQLLNVATHVTRALKWLPPMRKLNSKVESAAPVIALLKGQPVIDHLAGAAWRSRQPWTSESGSPVQRGDGIMWHTPLSPCKGKDINELNQLLSSTIESFGLEPLLTYVMITARTVVCPTTICFDQKCEDQMLRAKACLTELISRTEQAGFLAYRQPSFHCKQPSHFTDGLKQTLDPNRVLAIGRYGLA